MNYRNTLLPEFDEEMATTRRVLERLPDDTWDWKAHPNSNTIGWNANHIAEIPGWIENILTEPGFDYMPVDGEPHETPTHASSRDVLTFFDANVAEGRRAIETITDAAAEEMWTFYEAGKEIITLPRAAAMRSFVMNHIVHHRAILCVYYRLNDIPVPAIYGPSGDEVPSEQAAS